MARNWSHLRGKYPQLPLDPKHEDVLAAMRDTLRGKPLHELTALYNDVQAKLDALDAKMADLDAAKVALAQIMDGEMERTKQQNAVIDGFRWSRKIEPVGRVIDKAAFLAWAMKEMPDNLSMHYQTLNAEVKRALEANIELPDGVEVNTRQTVTRTKV